MDSDVRVQKNLTNCNDSVQHIVHLLIFCLADIFIWSYVKYVMK